MKKLGCATLLMVLLVLACLWKAGMLEAQGRAPTQTNPAIPPSCVAVGQPRSDPHHNTDWTPIRFADRLGSDDGQSGDDSGDGDRSRDWYASTETD